jgi:hypothetical protein
MDHNNRWTPIDTIRLVLVVTACVCLLLIVAGAMFGVLSGVLSPEQLGGIKVFSVSSGILGLAYVIYLVIQTALRARSDENPPQNLKKPRHLDSQDGFRDDL